MLPIIQNILLTKEQFTEYTKSLREEKAKDMA